MNKHTRFLLGSLVLSSASTAFTQNAVCPVPIENKIVFMGSSVCLGAAASNAGGPYDYYQSFDYNYRGYAFDYATLVNERFKQGKGGNWKFSNISVGGNNTSLLMNRWKKDLLPQCARYVVYGLSMANEGILTNPAAYDQFKTNMEKIIRETRDSGMVPMVVNNYANNEFTPEIYSKIKAMDLLIHGWDMPTINVLGSLDDGAGHWAPGHFSDGGHPNDKGYQEMAASIVPSLFDALKEGKPRPQRTSVGFVKLKTGDKLGFQPENGLRSFTLIVDIRTHSTGTVLEYKDGLKTGGLGIDSTGVLVYRSGPTGLKTKGKTSVNDGAWHTIALTHYAAIAKTFLYVDAVKQDGIAGETIHPTEFAFGGATGPDSADIRNLLFYRSGMTQTEMDAIKSGSFLQSSLEIYVPLEAQGKTPSQSIANLAQSRNVITADWTSTSTRKENRPTGGFNLIIADGQKSVRMGRVPDEVRIYNLAGKLQQSIQVNSNVVRWSPVNLHHGIYLLELNYSGVGDFRKIPL